MPEENTAVAEPYSAPGHKKTDSAPLVLTLLDDLMLSVRVQATIDALGYRFQSADDLVGLASVLEDACPAAVVLNLTAGLLPLPEVLARLRSLPGGMPPVIAFFPHVLADLGRAARDAGCTLVVPRSRFMAEMPDLLRRAIRRQVPVVRSDARSDG